MNRLLVFAIVGNVLLCGCVGSKVGWIDMPDTSPDEPGGKYAVDMCGKSVSDLEITGRQKRMDNDTLPVEIEFKPGTRHNDNGCFATLNNFVSFCTLGMWPYVDSETVPFSVTIRTPGNEVRRTGQISERSWNSFILPIAAFPCPGLGDWRDSGAPARVHIGADEYANAIVAVTDDVLTRKFYDKEIASWKSAKSIAVQKLRKRCAEEAFARAELPILLIDDKDVVNKTGSTVELSDVLNRLENQLNGLKMFRIVSKRAVARGIKEQELFQVLTGKAPEFDALGVPAYRIEAVVYAFDFGSETKPYVEQNDVVKSFRRGNRTTVKAHVELTLKVTDLKSGETMISENLSSEVSDQSEDGVSVMKGYGFNGGSSKLLNGRDYYLDCAMNEVLKKFYKRVCEKQKYRIASCSSSGTLVINIPAGAMEVGEKLIAYISDNGAVSADEGNSFVSEREVAVVKITNVLNGSCTAEFVSIKEPDCGWNVVLRKDVAPKDDSLSVDEDIYKSLLQRARGE